MTSTKAFNNFLLKTLMFISLFNLFRQEVKKVSRDSSYVTLNPDQVNNYLKTQLSFPNDEIIIGGQLKMVDEVSLNNSGIFVDQNNCKPFNSNLICYFNKQVISYDPKTLEHNVVWNLQNVSRQSQFKNLFVDQQQGLIQITLYYPNQDKTGVYIYVNGYKYFQIFQNELENIHLFNFELFQEQEIGQNNQEIEQQQQQVSQPVRRLMDQDPLTQSQNNDENLLSCYMQYSIMKSKNNKDTSKLKGKKISGVMVAPIQYQIFDLQEEVAPQNLEQFMEDLLLESKSFSILELVNNSITLKSYLGNKTTDKTKIVYSFQIEGNQIFKTQEIGKDGEYRLMAFRGSVYPNKQSTFNSLKANPIVIGQNSKNINVYDMYQITNEQFTISFLLVTKEGKNYLQAINLNDNKGITQLQLSHKAKIDSYLIYENNIYLSIKYPTLKQYQILQFNIKTGNFRGIVSQKFSCANGNDCKMWLFEQNENKENSQYEGLYANLVQMKKDLIEKRQYFKITFSFELEDIEKVFKGKQQIIISNQNRKYFGIIENKQLLSDSKKIAEQQIDYRYYSSGKDELMPQDEIQWT